MPHASPPRRSVVYELAQVRLFSAACLPCSEPPTHAFNDSPCFGNFGRRKVSKVFLPQNFARAENEHIFRWNLMFLRFALFVAIGFLDRENLPLLRRFTRRSWRLLAVLGILR